MSRRALVILALAVGTASASHAVDPDEIVATLGAWDFQILSGSPAASPTRDYTREVFAGNATLVANLLVPAGSALSRIAIEGCGNSGIAFAAIRAQLLSCSVNSSACSAIANVLHLFPGSTLVCDNYEAAAAGVIDNLGSSYFVQVNLDTPEDFAAFRAMRVYYRRQVSPDPLSSTFTDVPASSPWHQYVEALTAAGITQGCEPDKNFCPDDPVTRGQLAMMLAKAMGLFWPN
jgi:hypothetical protein